VNPGVVEGVVCVSIIERGNPVGEAGFI